MNWAAISRHLPDRWTLRYRRHSSYVIVGAVFLSVLCLAGCVQNSPSSSKERTVSLLLELLRDGDPTVRRMAVESLGKIGDPRTIDSILPLIHDPASLVREASVIALGRLKPTATDGVVTLLTLALEDPVESVRQAAVVAIGEVEPSSPLLEPVLRLLKSSDVAIRRTAARALLQIDASQSISALIAAGRDADAEVRQGIVAAVGEWGGPGVSPWLRERLVRDPSPGVRAEAAYRLGMLSDTDTRAALSATIAKDPDSGVRRWAKRGA
ncbi:MAG: HEAT repeat domain-containing protein [Nitrospirota bacterium]